MKLTAKNTTKECKQFLKAYDQYAESIFRYCLSRTSNPEVAKDLAQETFARAWKYNQTNKIEVWRPFLFRTASNLIISWYRKKRTRGESLDHIQEEAGFIPPDYLESMTAVGKAEYRHARTAIHLLNDLYRKPLILRFVEGYSIKEIATMLGVSENVVSVRINRGIQKLRTILDSHSLCLAKKNGKTEKRIEI